MSAQQKRMHLLSIMHVIAMLGLAAWWSLYFWRHTPARELFPHNGSAPPAYRATRESPSQDRAVREFATGARRAAAALAVAGADVAGGLVVLALFAIATGVYVRRLEIWLHARGAGETVTFAGTDLDDKAVAANTTRSRSR